MSANQYMETVTSFSASLIQGLGGDTEAAAEKADIAITDMADNANRMGTSIDMIQNAYQGFAKQNYTMLDNLKLGYGGTKSEMERLLVEAERLSGIKYDINNFADIVAAIHEVQGDLGILNATQTESIETIQGSAAAMKAAWSNMLTGFADENANIEDLVEKLLEKVAVFGDNIIPRIQQTLSGIAQGIQVAVPQIMEQIPPLITAVLPDLLAAAVTLASSLMSAITEAAPGILQTIMDILPQLIDTIVNIALEIVNALPEIIATIANALPTFLPALVEGAVNLISGLVAAIPEIISALIAAIPQVIVAIVNVLPTLLPALIEGAIGLINGIVTAIPQIIVALVAAIPQIIMAIVEALPAMLPALIEGAIGLVTGLVTAIPQIIMGLIAAIPQIIVSIIEGFAGFGEALAETLTSAVSGLGEWWGGVVDGAKTMKDNVQTEFENIKASASEKFTAVKESIGSAMNSAGATVQEKLASMKSSYDSHGGGIKGIVGMSMDGIKSLYSTGYNFINEKTQGGLDSVKEKFSSILGKAADIVRGAIDKIKNFFKFDWELPKLKLPHFSISGKFSLSPPQIPSFGVEWYKDGGVLTEPTAFGVNPSNGKTMIGGEAGAEAIAPIDVLQNYVRSAVSESNNAVAALLERILEILQTLAESSGDIALYNYIGTELLEEKILSANQTWALRTGGKA